MDERRLGDVASFVNGDRSSNYPSGADFVASGVPFISAADLTDASVDWASTKKISTAAYDRLSNGKTHIGDLLFSLRGSLGKVARVNEVERAAIASSLVIVRAKEGVLQDYLFYLLAGPVGQRAAALLDNGSVQGNISVRDLKGTPVPLPSPADQRAIVDVLGGLDAKIELNRRMNDTLEAMAQAIFRDWFVDFGPVRRMLAGETDPVAILGGITPNPARAAELAALFPAGLTDQGLPEGWTCCPIGDQVEIAGGSTPSTADDSLWFPAEHRWATPKDLSNMSDLALFETGRRISSAGLAKITSGLLPAGTVLLSSRAPIGYLAIAQEPVAINQGFIALKPTADHGSAYLYLWCKANMEAILANANGSTFQEISKKNFRPITSAVPADPAILRAFGEIAQPLIDRIISAARENFTLAQTRDYLLPRLMSGQVRVGNIGLEVTP